MKPSFRSRLISSVLKIFNLKKQVEKQSTQSLIRRSKKDFTPKIIHRKYTVKTQTIDNKSVTTFEDKYIKNTHLFFLHGGAYIFEAGSIHWAFSQKILDKIHCRMTLIDYPLAPEHGYKATFKMVNKTYHSLLEQFPNDDFVFIGDSAGAGLAMGFYQQLQLEKATKLPSKIILLSPWLDITMMNPDAKKHEATDYLLTIQMLQNAANHYAKGDDQTQYLLSPINGDFTNFPSTIVFYSDSELFYQDCIKLKSIVRHNDNFIFKEYHNMLHDWPMFPIPESDRVVEEICAFIG
ncbi:MAG: alpha/beta hydrolase fold domain-containing protein [Saprospiraceae bacterium]